MLSPAVPNPGFVSSPAAAAYGGPGGGQNQEVGPPPMP